MAPGLVADTAAAAADAAQSLGGRVVVKAQVLTGGRGKAGGVRLAMSVAEAESAARDILAMHIKGLRVDSVLVVPALDIQAEYYVSLTVDRGAKAIACCVSASGGVDIETVAQQTPDEIQTVHIASPDLAAEDAVDDRVVSALRRAFREPELVDQATTIAQAMYRLMVDTDASLVEINPLVVIEGNKLIAADAKIVLDDNALFKHPELEAIRNDEESSPDEIEAHKAGLSYVKLDGSIGCMVNGAGLAMATMDSIQLLGGSPANFLDVGGSSAPRKVIDAVRILLRNEELRVILVNIFGGLTRCDDIARGLLMAREELKTDIPMVVRLVGTNDEEGRALLSGAGIAALTNMTEAVEQAVACAVACDRICTGDFRDCPPDRPTAST